MIKLLIAYDNYTAYHNAKVRFLSAQVNIVDGYTPFGIEEDNNLNNRRFKPGKKLAKYGTIFGFIGLLLSLGFQYWTFAKAYPLNIGGKPTADLLAFIPVSFECSILFAAVALTGLFLRYKRSPHQGQISELLSHDYFVLELETTHTFNRHFFEETKPQQLKRIS